MKMTDMTERRLGTFYLLTAAIGYTPLIVGLPVNSIITGLCLFAASLSSVVILWYTRSKKSSMFIFGIFVTCMLWAMVIMWLRILYLLEQRDGIIRRIVETTN